MLFIAKEMNCGIGYRIGEDQKALGKTQDVEGLIFSRPSKLLNYKQLGEIQGTLFRDRVIAAVLKEPRILLSNKH